VQSDPPLYIQETTYSCAPACLRMILASQGPLKTEEEVRSLCDCVDILGGTDAFKLVEAARSLGFQKSYKCNLDIDELERLVADGVRPIAFLGVRLSHRAGYQLHAAVILKVGRSVALNDPLRQRLTLSRAEFFTEWNRARRLVVIVES
jgi:ABC-type bacteriocin/lantibiotic exporter with double-glycine peptidase domain